MPEKVYDETIGILQTGVQRAKIGQSDKLQAIRRLSGLAQRAEEGFIPDGNVQEWIDKERQLRLF